MQDFDFEQWASEEIIRLQSGINLRRPSDYQSLFKYISLNSETSWGHLRRTVHKSELAGSSALTLNDPFELSPYVFDDLTPNTIAESVRHVDNARWLSDQEAKPLKEVFPDPAPYRKQAMDYLDMVATRYRIIAFCERVDSSLLWAHYANSYQGACLHFLAKGFRWHRHNTLGKVSYSKHRPAYPLSLALALSTPASGPPIPRNATPLRRAESNQILFFTKAEDWAYEAESRIVYDPKDADAVKFKQDSLVSIITGPRFDEDNLRRLKQTLKGSPYEQIPIRKARLSKTTFTVEVDESAIGS